MEYDNEIGFEYDSNWRAGIISSAIYNTLRSKKTDKVWTPYDMGLGLKKPSTVSVKTQKPISKNEWDDYKSMLKACGKPVLPVNVLRRGKDKKKK